MAARMKIPDWAKKHTCILCGQSCIKLTDGDGWVHKPTGTVLNLSVCRDCYIKGRKPGNRDAALEAAAELHLEYLRAIATRAAEKSCSTRQNDDC